MTWQGWDSYEFFHEVVRCNPYKWPPEKRGVSHNPYKWALFGPPFRFLGLWGTPPKKIAIGCSLGPTHHCHWGKLPSPTHWKVHQPKKKWDMPGMYLKFMYFFLVFTQNLKPYTFFLPWSLFLYRKPSIFIASCLVHGHLKAPLIHLEAEVLRWRNPPIFPTFRKSLYFWCNWGSMNLENSSGVRHIYIYIYVHIPWKSLPP